MKESLTFNESWRVNKDQQWMKLELLMNVEEWIKSWTVNEKLKIKRANESWTLNGKWTVKESFTFNESWRVNKDQQWMKLE